MRTKRSEPTGVVNLRGISRDLLYRFKLGAYYERKTVKGLLVDFMERKVEEWEKKGVVPKGK